jgi:RNA polymerase sigma-70 factor (ECF subfamily)
METEVLLERFREGDPDAVRELFRRYAGGVQAVANRSLSDRSLADEAVQQTFVQAWRAADRVDPTRDPAPWLYTIARRVAIDLYRREDRRRAESYDHDDGTARAAGARLVSLPPSLDQAWDAWQVRLAVDELGDDEQAIVRMQHFDELTHQEIADRLQIPVGTVKSRSYRAHRRLAAALGHLADDGEG